MEHLTFKRSNTGLRQGASSGSNNSHKTMRQNLDRMESTVTAIPQTLGEYMDTFNTFCISGIKFASLLETVFQDTPILLVALRFREACEQMSDKCGKSTLMLKGEVVPPVTKKLAPSLSHLRSRIDSHAKALSKHESYARQLENLSSAQNPNKQKLEQVEGKFQASAKDFAKEDLQLAEAMNEVHKMRVEVSGTCGGLERCGLLKIRAPLIINLVLKREQPGVKNQLSALFFLKGDIYSPLVFY